MNESDNRVFLLMKYKKDEAVESSLSASHSDAKSTTHAQSPARRGNAKIFEFNEWRRLQMVYKSYLEEVKKAQRWRNHPN